MTTGIEEKMFTENLSVLCELQEQVILDKNLIVAVGIDIKEMIKNDPNPMFVSVRLVGDNSIGDGTVDAIEPLRKKYLPSFVAQVIEQVKPKSNSDSIKLYPGHQKPEDVGYGLRDVLGVFVGSTKERGAAFGHCYIMPSATQLREQISKKIYPKVSIEARGKMRWNATEKVIEVFELEEFKGVAVANSYDAGIADAGIVKTIQEMNTQRKEDITKMSGEKGTSKDLTTPVNVTVNTGDISEMSAQDILSKRPDLKDALQKDLESGKEVEAQMTEMQTSIDTQKTALEGKDTEIAAEKKRADEASREIAEMKKSDELGIAKAEILKPVHGKYPEKVMELIEMAVKGDSKEDMQTAFDAKIKELETLGVKAGEKTVEVSEMITGGVVEGGSISEVNSAAPSCNIKEAMQIKFNSLTKINEKKFAIFGGNIAEMRNHYSAHGLDQVKTIMSVDLKEMQTRDDFPDLLEFGLEPLLIDSYFSELVDTQYQNFFTPFRMTRNSIPFPSLKGFQIGRIVEGEEPPIVNLRPGPKTTVTAEDFGSLLKITHAMLRDGEIDVMRYNVIEVGRAHARMKDHVAAYLLANSAGQTLGPVTNTVAELRAARIAGMEIYETDTGIKRPRWYNSIIMSPARLEELVPVFNTTYTTGLGVDPVTGDITGVAGMKIYVWMEVPDDFALLVVAKDKMMEAVREDLTIANAEDFKTRSEMVRSGEAYTFAVLDTDNVMKVEFT